MDEQTVDKMYGGLLYSPPTSPNYEESAPERTIEEIKDSTKYGDLFQVVRVHSDKYVAARVRRRGDSLFAHTDQIVTMIRTDKAKMIPEVGDFCFRDRKQAGRKPAWSLWKVREKSK